MYFICLLYLKPGKKAIGSRTARGLFIKASPDEHPACPFCGLSPRSARDGDAGRARRTSAQSLTGISLPQGRHRRSIPYPPGRTKRAPHTAVKKPVFVHRSGNLPFPAGLSGIPAPFLRYTQAENAQAAASAAGKAYQTDRIPNHLRGRKQDNQLSERGQEHIDQSVSESREKIAGNHFPSGQRRTRRNSCGRIPPRQCEGTARVTVCRGDCPDAPACSVPDSSSDRTAFSAGRQAGPFPPR